MPPAPVSRRTAVRVGAWAAVAGVLSGCSGDRLRTPWAPEPPEEQTGPDAPDLALVRAARDRVLTYRATLAQVQPAESSRDLLDELDEIWGLQAERLDALLSALGAGPADDAAAASGAAPADDAAVTSSGPLEALDLGRALRADREVMVADIAGSTSTNRAMLLSLSAQHLLSADRLGAGIDWPALVGPTGAAAVPVLASTRPAVFALEVVAARSGGEEREVYEDVLAPLRGVTRTLTTLAGDAAPVPPLGYDLPEPLADRSDRRELARSVVQDIAPAVLRVADRAGSAPDQVESVLRLTVEATAWSLRLGTQQGAFPGMDLP
ncbi:Membrane glycoprotein [Serinicoccus hydrothermalis]|uniref:Membrane glycoprotein n=1 Tax=Serinicoccus hydrothermalis TaxID=1758689 RepID=A0A1B1N7L9_9MICO|nr:DUF4439 domain-containing protein [Serinicoccus hydrothermalis]ANS77411.1 Membrane glycoprotein [Serinicoccus hydrothermalis]